MAKPSDMAHRALHLAQQPDPLDRSVEEIELLMAHWLDSGYNTSESIALTDLTLSNIVEDQ